MKILISGGHLTPALAFCDFLQQKTESEIVFVGREFTQLEHKQESVEKLEVEKRSIRFIPFHSGKLTQPKLSEYSIQFIHFVGGLRQAWKILSREKPDIFVSFGSYVAVPLALTAWLRRIPVITHEQTRAPGFANRTIAHFARFIAVSYPETVEYFPQKKTVITGNPLRTDILAKQTHKPDWLPNYLPEAILYVTGGSQGSQFINQLIVQVLPELTRDWCVIHQCGKATQKLHALEELEQVKKHLNQDGQRRYFVKDWIDSKDLAWILQHMKLAISRAGANTVQEITLAGKPTIFIPLPLSHHDEQGRNAEAVAKTGAAIVISQKDASPEKLLEEVSKCVREYKDFSTRAKYNQEHYPKDGAQQLYALVSKTIPT